MVNRARPLPRSVELGIGNASSNCFIGAESAGLLRNALDGTVVVAVKGWRSRRPSYEKKKKVLLRMSGPPKTPPKSFCRSLPFGSLGVA